MCLLEMITAVLVKNTGIIAIGLRLFCFNRKSLMEYGFYFSKFRPRTSFINRHSVNKHKKAADPLILKNTVTGLGFL